MNRPRVVCTACGLDGRRRRHTGAGGTRAQHCDVLPLSSRYAKNSEPKVMVVLVEGALDKQKMVFAGSRSPRNSPRSSRCSSPSTWTPSRSTNSTRCRRRSPCSAWSSRYCPRSCCTAPHETLGAVREARQPVGAPGRRGGALPRGAGVVEPRAVGRHPVCAGVSHAGAAPRNQATARRDE